MKILVRGANWIGDAVMSVPALRQLRRIFPDDHITLHSRSWAEGIFRDASFIDEIIAFESQRWKFREIIDNADFLRQDEYEFAVLFPNSLESSLTALLSKIPRRVGYNKDLRGLLLTDPVPVPEWKNRRHESYYYLNLVCEVERRLVGTTASAHAEMDTRIEISEYRKEQARTDLGDAGVDMSRRLVGLGVGSTNSRAKRWPVERFAELNDRLHEAGCSVVLLGSPDDAEVASRVGNACIHRPTDLTGKTSLDSVAAILSVLNLFISNDMGLAHLAPAVETETIAIFGPTNPDTTRPLSHHATVVREPVDCSPCMLRDCPIDLRCMTRIDAGRLFDLSMEKLLAEPVAL